MLLTTTTIQLVTEAGVQEAGETTVTKRGIGTMIENHIRRHEANATMTMIDRHRQASAVEAGVGVPTTNELQAAVVRARRS